MSKPDLNLDFELSDQGVPQNLEAEEAVIGLLLAEPDRAGELFSSLDVDDFELDIHCSIWKVAQSLYQKGKPITPEAIYNTFAMANLAQRFDKAGGIPYLVELVESVPDPIFIPHYIKALANASYRRRIIKKMKAIQVIATHTRGETDFLDSAIATVYQTVLKPVQAKRSDRLIFSAVDFAAGAGRAPDWLVQDLLLQGGLNLLAGDVGSGKTFLALDLAVAAASGGPVWRRECDDRRKSLWEASPQPEGVGHGGPVPPMGVLYFCLDTSRQTIQRRLAALCRGRSIPLPANLYIDFSPLDLSQARSLAVLRGLIKEYQAGLVILDALARYLPGIDENTVASVGPVLTGLRSVVAETGATILILHHLNKGYGSAHKIPSGLRIRGSSDILAAVDTALITTSVPSARAGRVPQSPHAGRRLIPVKNREQPESPPLFFDILTDENGGLRISFQDHTSPAPLPPPLTALERVLALLQQQPGRPLTRPDIVARLIESSPPVSRRTFDRVFVELRSHPSIQVNRDARTLKYTWAGPPSSPPL